MPNTLRTIPISPLGGMWTLDAPQDLDKQGIPPGASPDMVNFQIYNGYIRKRPGYAKFQPASSFPASPIMGIYSAQQVAGTRALYVVNRVGVFKYNTATTNYDAQTGPALTGTASQFFSFEVSQNN